MARNSTDFNRLPTDDRSASSPAPAVSTIRGEAKLVQRLLAFLEQTRGDALDLPAELAPLADSRFVLPTSATTCLGMGAGPHTAGQVVQRFNALGTLTTAIDTWSSQQPPEQREQLAGYLHAHVRGLLSGVSLESALAWLRPLRTPIPLEVCERLGVSVGTSWGSAVQTLLPDPALAPSHVSAVEAAPLPSPSPTSTGPVPSPAVVPPDQRAHDSLSTGVRT